MNRQIRLGQQRENRQNSLNETYIAFHPYASIMERLIDSERKIS